MRPAGLIVLILALAGCNRTPPSAVGPRNIVLVPAENLTGDPSLDWMAGAIPALLSEQLELLPNSNVQRFDRYPDATAIPRAETLLCRYEGGGKSVEVRCWTKGKEQLVSVTGDPALLSSWIATIGRYIDAAAGNVPAVPSSALQAMAAHRYEDAIAQAPEFGTAYLEGVAYSVKQGDAKRAAALLEASEKVDRKLAPLARARLHLAHAGLARDREAELAALRELDKIQVPDEARQRSELALLQSLGRSGEAAKILEKLIEAHPERGEDWNDLAYLRAWAGDLNGAIQAVEKYRSLAPGQPNPLDSMGEIYYYFRKFPEAEKAFLDCAAKAPQFNGSDALYKAALARLHMGDVTAATAHFEKFTTSHQAEKALLDANWSYLTGKTTEASTHLLQKAGTWKGDAAAQAYIQLAFWDAARGDAAAARQNLGRAVSQQPSNALRAVIAVVALIATPDADTVDAQATKIFPLPAMAQLRQTATALALAVHNKTAETIAAATALRTVERPGADRVSRIVLARSLNAAGKGAEAAELLKTVPIPGSLIASPWESWLIDAEVKLSRQR